MSLLDKIQQNIAERDLLVPGRPVLVGVSGGADSVALLYALNSLGYECVAMHCNYHLRGEESNRDMRYVQKLCRHLGVDLYVRDFDVEARRASTGESVEMACRELRYAWFADLLDRLRAQAIAVAHHREDNVETFMLNLMRGSGIAGLTGMRWRNGFVVRPMLDATRAEIEQYLESHGIEWVDDSTNTQTVFARNKLRNIILPLLSEHFPGAIDGILASISHLTENRAFYDTAVAEKRSVYATDREIDLQRLVADNPDAALLLYEWLRPLGFNATHVANILSSAGKSGITFASGNTTLLVDRGRIIISGNSAAPTDEYQVSLRHDILSPVHITVTEHPVTDFKPERDPNVAYFDVEVLVKGGRWNKGEEEGGRRSKGEEDPVFVLRHWRKGDRMHPYGMNGTRLLSDIYSDAKLSLADKRRAWVLTCNGEILWAVGLRQSTLYSITPSTRRYLMLEIK